MRNTTNLTNQKEVMSTGKYYLSCFAGAIKRFTETLCMKSIVNGFIAVMPVIIVASIFTLLTSLPDMIIHVAMSTEKADAITNSEGFQIFAKWGSNINNWSMGIVGMFVTVSISKQMGSALNERLPLDRRINELTLMFAAISTYIMLSVIEFSIAANSDAANMFTSFVNTGTFIVDGPAKTGRAIFVDGLAAQGILPGILIALTMPWFFYWAYKYNWTIRLPKQVPQTISQAFIGIIPLFIVLLVYGTIAFGFNLWLQQPVLFWLFTQIQNGLTNNPNINDSYGLIAIYTVMEGGFWFLGVHPEPVHALMRATFWTNNLQLNDLGQSHIFTEPYMYGFGAMGGSGCTLMIPVLCLLFARSERMKVVGKTGWLPILFQVNEPVLFSVPTILNPVFFIPMIFTGMANDMVFKAITDATNFQASGLNLPWSTPYFLQTTLGTPTAWQPWLMTVIALGICCLFYGPAVIIQDRMYLKEENKNKFNMNNKSIRLAEVAPNGIDNIKAILFDHDFDSDNQLKKFKEAAAKEIKKTKIENPSKLEATKKRLEKEQLTLELKLNRQKLDNLLKGNKNRLTNKNKSLIGRLGNSSDTIEMKIADGHKIIDNKIAKIERKVGALQDALLVFEKSKTTKLNKMIKAKQKALTREINSFNKNKKPSEQRNLDLEVKKIANSIKLADAEKTAWGKFANKKIASLKKRIAKLENKIANWKAKYVSIRSYKDQDVIYLKKYEKAFAKSVKNSNKIIDRHIKRENKIIAHAKAIGLKLNKTDISKYKDIADKKAIENKIKDFKKLNEKKIAKAIDKNKSMLRQGKNPWSDEVEEATSANNTTKKSAPKAAKATESKSSGNVKNILVLCLGAGSSAVLANTINKGLKEIKKANLARAIALAWGSHDAALPSSDLVILSPQMGANAKSLANLAKQHNFVLWATQGREYIELSRNPKEVAKLVLQKLNLK